MGIFIPPIFTREFISSLQTITAGGLITVAHSFNIRPKMILLELECTTAGDGYSIGDIIYRNIGMDDYSASLGSSVVADATNILVRITATGIAAQNKNTGVVFSTNILTNFKLRIKGYV